MSDFNVSVQVRNARLLRMIREKFGSNAELSRVSGVSASQISGLLTMRQSAFREDGSLRDCVADLLSALGCTPEEIWPEHMARIKLRKSRAEFEMDSAEVEEILIGGDASARASQRNLIGRWAEVLRPREIEVIGLRQSGLTYREVGSEMNFGPERVRQIELRAYKKMRRRALRDGVKCLADAS